MHEFHFSIEFEAGTKKSFLRNASDFNFNYEPNKVLQMDTCSNVNDLSRNLGVAPVVASPAVAKIGTEL